MQSICMKFCSEFINLLWHTASKLSCITGPDPPVVSLVPMVVSEFGNRVEAVCSIQPEAYEMGANPIQWTDTNVCYIIHMHNTHACPPPPPPPPPHVVLYAG